VKGVPVIIGATETSAGSMLKYVEDIPQELSSAELQKAILGAAHLLIGEGIGEKEKNERKNIDGGKIIRSEIVTFHALNP
jgi:hypothetical protein